MGKQNRRKRNNNKKGGGSDKQNPTDSSSTSSAPDILSRIRHGDPRVRDGVLSALTVTLFAPSSSNGSKKDVISDALLKAVSERIAMETDIPTAQRAVGCFMNYIFGSEKACHRIMNEVPNLDITTVLLARIRRVLTVVQDVTSATTKSLAEFEVTCKCLLVLCTLVESSPECVDRLCHTGGLSAGQLSPLEIILHTMSAAYSLLAASTTTTTGSAENGNGAASNVKSTPIKENLNEAMKEHIRESLIASARLLHGAFDGNPTLVKQLLSISNLGTTSCSGLQTLIRVVSDAHCPAKARLHCAGAAVNARQHAAAVEESTHRTLDECISQTVLPVLVGYLDYRPEVAEAMAQRVMDTKNALEQETKDAKMEHDAEMLVRDRKEPARMIAKRIKKEKAEKQKKKKEMEDVAMEEEDESSDTKASDMPSAETAADGSKKKEEEDVDGRDLRENYNKALSAWQAASLPLKISLEVSTNLCSVISSEDDEGLDGWLSDDEDNMESMAQSMDITQDKSSASAQDKVLFSSIVKSGLPDGVLALLGVLCCHPLGNATSTSASQTDTTKQMPGIISYDITELQTKCGACLGNVIANLPFREGLNETLELWRLLSTAMSALFGQNNGDSNNGENGTVGISGAMLAIIKTRNCVLSSIGEADLTLIMKLLHTAQMEEVRQNASTMLGVLCTEPHSKEVNAMVCAALVRVLNNDKSPMAVGEALCALMDIYGGEDAHDDVFLAQGVLNEFQKTLPTFRRRMKELGIKSLAEEDLYQLRETALNASRFIKYKQDQLKQ